VVAESAFKGTKITVLSLAGNALETPPDLSAIAASLEELFLYSNRLIFFPPEYFSQMVNLKRLELNNNQLTNVPRLQGLLLDYLYLHNNSIELRPGDFHDVSVKKKLDLSINNISDITPLFDLANSPDKLRLHDNDLSKVTAADLQRITQGSLKYLYVHNCNLTTFPDMRNYDFQTRFYFGNGFQAMDNNFICDCRMFWMSEMRQIHEKNLGQLNKWTCASPVPLRGKTILDVSLAEFCPGTSAS
jgi:Leucine-rich repeat (LRR) protein